MAKQYGFYMDTERCIKCWACEIACKQWNGIEAGTIARRKVHEVTSGTFPNVTRTFVSMSCMHCGEPACAKVCPAGAITKRGEDGIVVVDKEKCIGCKSCIMACPYGARYYRENEDGYFGTELNEYEAVMYTAMPQGRVDKCTFCVDRIDAGGNEPQACVAACPAGARVFGDLETLKKQAESAAGFQLLPDEGANPSVWYLPNKVNA